MEHLFVPYKLVLKLRDKGFNETCLMNISFNKLHLCNGCDVFDEVPIKYEFIPQHDGPNSLGIPIYQQVVDWLREKHGIVIRHDHHDSSWGSYDPLEKYFEFVLIKVVNNRSFNALHPKDRGRSFDTFYEAFNFIIEEALELI